MKEEAEERKEEGKEKKRDRYTGRKRDSRR